MKIHPWLQHYYALLGLHAEYWFICWLFPSVSSLFKSQPSFAVEFIPIFLLNSVSVVDSILAVIASKKCIVVLLMFVSLSGKSWILEQNYFFLSRPITATKIAGFPLWVWHCGPLCLRSNRVLQCSHGKCSREVRNVCSAILFLWNSK